MSLVLPNTEVARALNERAQSDASDPSASAWVAANAGTGKTHVLTLRVLRLLLAGTEPERILCLTYTKAAAAEMSKRIFDTLAGWVMATESDLAERLAKVLGRVAQSGDLSLARTLFARAIETPGGLKIQTIHAFAERLLQRFPLEAGVTPGFRILDEIDARDLRRRATEATLTAATGNGSSSLGRSLNLVIRYAAESNFDDLLAKAIDERAWLEAASTMDLDSPLGDFAAAAALLRQAFGIPPGATIDDLEIARSSVLSNDDLLSLRMVLSRGGKTDCECAEKLKCALESSNAAQRGAALELFFLVTNGESRARLMSNALVAVSPDLDATARDAQAQFLILTQHVKGLRLIEASAALYCVASDVLQRYGDAKQTASALDFDDLIMRTRSLLLATGAADWVLFKLDGGLDHILVDEAQDTSPEQWSIIEALAREFFAGSGARDVARTMFAVGDEKQSIYSFQGAAPEMFAAIGQTFSELVRSAEGPWRHVPLNLSFRSVQPVLAAVDKVFADAGETPGLTASGDPIQHVAFRVGRAGVLEVWPPEVPSDRDDADPWKPLEDSVERAPANRLANRIADTIAGWLQRKERLESENRPIEAGDILILVRKRNPFAVPMVAALKRRGVPVAGSDRMALTEQIAVQDLMVLADFLTLPEDDLALATVLKGPIFNLTDDDLLLIAPKRQGTLWRSLLKHAESGPLFFKPAAERLKRWRAKADFMPPFEFFSSVLDRDGVRSALLHRLGSEAAEPIDEFLDLALAYDDSHPPSLTGFVTALRAEVRDVKRDMDMTRNEVRVMTVHSAKGLEAPIVFLPDTCTSATGDMPATRLLDLPNVERPSGVPDPVIWPIKGTSRLPAVVRASSAKNARDSEERNRLLYVAMTRARDRLYISGFQGQRPPPADCWYSLIERRLIPGMPQVELADGRRAWREHSPQTAKDFDKPKVTFQAATDSEDLPAFATRRAALEPQLSVPLAPSRLEPYAPDAEGEPLPARKRDVAATTDGPSPHIAAGGDRFLRGTLTHALLQHLPGVAAHQRHAVASAFIERRGTALAKPSRDSVVRETLAVLATPDFESLFGPSSRAEVPISAILPRPRGSGPALRLSGQIDRLVVTSNDVVIVDYKTNRPPPTTVSGVAEAYLFQLAAYVLALREIYPGQTVRAALLWTDGPRLMEIPAPIIDGAIDRLWDLDVASLDAP